MQERRECAHTPGPWRCERDNGSRFTVIGEPIAIVGGKETGERVRFTVGRTCDYGAHGEVETTANAHLIAAAPELLAALAALVNDAPYVSMEDDCECGDFADNGSCVHTRAHQVIRQARGE